MLSLWNSFFGLGDPILKFLLLIDSKIYWAFSKLYSFYIELARLRIFDTNIFSNIIDNVYIIFGVVALFLVAFILLKEMVASDDQKSGKIIFDMIKRFVFISIIVVLIPTLFNFLYDFQDALLTQGTIEKILLSNPSAMDYSVSPFVVNTDDNIIYTTDCSKVDEFKKTFSENSDGVSGAPDIQNYECEEQEIDTNNDTSAFALESAGYKMGYYVLNGFLAPAEGIDDITVGASDYMNISKGIDVSIKACLTGGGLNVLAALVVGANAAAQGTLVAPGVGTVVGGVVGLATYFWAGCKAGGALATAGSRLAYIITYENYKWSDAVYEIMTQGAFDRITAFEPAIIDGRMDYTPIISTVAGIILLYMIFSFCLDLGIRAAKLAFLEVLAPICLLISIIPSKKDLMSRWFKKLGVTYAEVFVRVFCVCGVAMLVSKLDNTIIGQLPLIAKAVIVLGLVAFAKQLPKFLSEITGLESGNIKLGIREKLAEGGAFVVGSTLGGGMIAGVRNLAGSFEKGKDGKWHKKAGARPVRSTIGGVFSGGFRAGKSGLNAKNFTDTAKSASAGAKGATDARNRRNAYRVKHQGENIMAARVADKIQDAKEWLSGGFEAEEARIKAYDDILSTQDQLDAETDKLMSKFATNVNIVAMPRKFKGVDNANLINEFTNLFTGQSMATIQNTIASLKRREIKREDFGQGAAGEMAYQKAVRDYNEKISAFDSMYEQLRKETRKNVQSGVMDKSVYSKWHLEDKDVEGVQSFESKLKNQFDAMGRSAEININEAYDPTNPQGARGAGYSIDEATTRIKSERARDVAEYERKKAARDARRNN